MRKGVAYSCLPGKPLILSDVAGAAFRQPAPPKVVPGAIVRQASLRSLHIFRWSKTSHIHDEQTGILFWS